MNIKKNRAFTMLELVIVMAFVGILMMSTIVYLGTNDTRRTIEAQGCVTTVGGQIHNYLFYALTSKKLRLDEYTTVSPEYYIIQLTGALNPADTSCNSTGSICDEILFSYDTGDQVIQTYSRPSLGSCHGGDVKIGYYWSGESEIKQITMNKGFAIATDDPFDKKVFALENLSGDKLHFGDIVVVYCFNTECSYPKQMSKFSVDGRSETITIKNCIYYDDDDLNKCKKREGE